MSTQTLQTQSKQNSLQVNAGKKPKPEQQKVPGNDDFQLHPLLGSNSGDLQLSPQNIIFLQRTIGNQAVGRLIQTKLKIGQPGDKYEQEADQVADTVVRMPLSTLDRQSDEEKETQSKSISEQITPLVQRQVAEEEDKIAQTKSVGQFQAKEEEPLQTKLEAGITSGIQLQDEDEEKVAYSKPLIEKQATEDKEREQTALLTKQKSVNATTSSTTEPSAVSNAIDNVGASEPLKPSTKHVLESHLGADLHKVRVHNDSTSNEAARELNARAFTHKNDIWLGQSESQNDLHLMAHETTHVLQQGGVVRRKPMSDNEQQKRTQETVSVIGKEKPLAPGLSTPKLKGGVPESRPNLKRTTSIAGRTVPTAAIPHMVGDLPLPTNAPPIAQGGEFVSGVTPEPRPIPPTPHETSAESTPALASLEARPVTVTGTKASIASAPTPAAVQNLAGTPAEAKAKLETTTAPLAGVGMSTQAEASEITPKSAPTKATPTTHAKGVPGETVKSAAISETTVKAQPAVSTKAPPLGAPERVAKISPTVAGEGGMASGISGAAAPSGAPSGVGGHGAGTPPPPPKMDTSSSESLLQSLATVPASSFGEAVSIAVSATPQIQQQEKADLQASLPEVERPTGLPRLSERPKPEPTELQRGKVPVTENPGSRKGQPPETRHEAAVGPTPGSKVSTAVAEPSEKEDGSWWSWLFDRVHKFLSNLPTTDSGVSTSAGPRPNVDMTGEADPTQNEQVQQASNQEVFSRGTEADAATMADFGENDIYPTVPAETLRSSYKPEPPSAISGKGAMKPSALSDDARAAFDQGATPWLNGKVNEQLEQHRKDKAEYQRKSQETQEDGQRQIAEETKRVRAEQEGIQQGAHADVDAKRQSWREENRKIQEEYVSLSESKRQEVDQKIQTEVKTSEAKADTELTKAENKAEEERLKAEAKAAEEKRKAENRTRSWWDKVKGAISDVFDAIKKAVNVIFDALRAVVKGIIEVAKAIVHGIIELARLAIVGLIKAFGEYVKGLVTIALIAFPEKAKAARDWIDGKINTAVNAVNKAADWLKEVYTAIYDWIGKTLDTLLKYVQTGWNIALSVFQLIATGQFYELWEKLKNLGQAAWDGLGMIEGEIWKELVGFDITKDLGPQLMGGESGEGGVGDAVTTAIEEGQGDPDNIKFFLADTIREDQVVIDPTPELEVDDELLDELDMEEGETRHLGEDNDPERSGDGVKAELLRSLPQETIPSDQKQSEEAAAQTDPAMQEIINRAIAAKDRTERLAVIKDLMWQTIKTGIKKFWEEKLKPNLVWIIPAAIAAIAAFIAAEILTGGAITAAIPIILQIVAGVFIAQALAKVAEGLTIYLEKGWAGDVPGAARGFARGIATGAIELIFALLAEVGGLALKGALKAIGRGIRAAARGTRAVAKAALGVAKAAVKGVVKGVLYVGKLAVKAAKIVGRIVARGGKIVLEKGRLFFKGITSTFARGIKKLDDLFKRLKEWFSKFKGFSIKIEGNWLVIYAEFNPRRPIAKIPLFKWTQAWNTKKNARILRRELEAAGQKLKPGEAAHHIVPSTHPRADEARIILKNFKIDVNSATNGLPLSKNLHEGLHTYRYIDKVTELLKGAKSPPDVTATLNKIAKLIKAGNFP